MATEDVTTVEETEAAFLDGALDDQSEEIEAVEEVEPSEPEAEIEEESDGPARGPDGKFVKKEEAEAEGVAEAPAAQSSEAPAPEATAPEVPEVPAVPFTVRVNKQEFTLDGATYTPGKGLSIADDKVEFTRQLIQEGVYYKQNWKTLEKQAEDRGAKRAIETDTDYQRGKALAAQLDALFSGDPDALQLAYENWATHGPMYKERAMREIAERQLQQMREGQKSQTEEAETHRLEQEKQYTLTETIGELKAVPDLKVLAKEDWDWVDEQIALLSQRNALFVTQEDGTYLDVPAIERIAAHALKVRMQVVDAAKRAEEAAKFNAANRKVAAPVASAPTAPRKGSAPKQKAPEPDARDVTRAFLEGTLDDDD